MATESNILAWKIPQTEEPSRLPSMESKKVGYDLAYTPITWPDSTRFFCDPHNNPLRQYYHYVHFTDG